jgi:large subunit ribosomal protein L30
VAQKDRKAPGGAEKKPARRKAASGSRKPQKATANATAESSPTPGLSRGTAQGPAGARLRVRQVRSGIGHAATYRRTLTALGLKRHQDEVVVPDHPSVRGMLRKVAHLVRVETVEA